jgi:phosphoribosylglycinamide formyltransferase-1
LVTPELDGGPILGQARVPVLHDDTAVTLATRVLAQEHRLYPLVLKRFCEGDLSRIDLA